MTDKPSATSHACTLCKCDIPFGAKVEECHMVDCPEVPEIRSAIIEDCAKIADKYRGRFYENDAKGQDIGAEIRALNNAAPQGARQVRKMDGEKITTKSSPAVAAPRAVSESEFGPVTNEELDGARVRLAPSAGAMTEPRRIEPQYLTASVSGQWVKDWQDYADQLSARSSAALTTSLVHKWHDKLGAMIDQVGHPDFSLREFVDGLCLIRDDMMARSSVPSATAATALNEARVAAERILGAGPSCKPRPRSDDQGYTVYEEHARLCAKAVIAATDREANE